MSWKIDIAEWAHDNNRDPSKVENICLRKGWVSDKYHPEMKDALHNWLTEWYTLSVKNLSAPATAVRRNPDSIFCHYCRKNVIIIKRLYDGPILGSCSDILHDNYCHCGEC